MPESWRSEAKEKSYFEEVRPGSRLPDGRLPTCAIVPQPVTLQAELCHVVAFTLDVMTTNPVVTMYLACLRNHSSKHRPNSKALPA